MADQDDVIREMTRALKEVDEMTRVINQDREMYRAIREAGELYRQIPDSVAGAMRDIERLTRHIPRRGW